MDMLGAQLQESFSRLLEFLGALVCDDISILLELLLPNFNVLDEHVQDSVLKYIRQRWDTLKSNPDIVSALKKLAFVTVLNLPNMPKLCP